MQDILKETVDYYAKDPVNRRSIDKDGNCQYTWGKTHCAVGRYMQEIFQQEDWEQNNDSVNELCDETEAWDIDWAVREEVQGLEPDFWKDLQDFHDSRHNWIYKDTFIPPDADKVGLSDRGKEYYSNIKKNITEGRYDG